MTTLNASDLSPNSKQRKMFLGDYFRAGIHEMAHHAGPGSYFSDGRLAQAAYNLGFTNRFDGDPDTHDEDMIGRHSSNLNGVLKQFCGQE